VDFVNARKLILLVDFRAKNALLSLDFVDREKRILWVAFSRKTDQGRWNS
jgi:hypothetical protein